MVKLQGPFEINIRGKTYDIAYVVSAIVIVFGIVTIMLLVEAR
jgi:hypothetical protein